MSDILYTIREAVSACNVVDLSPVLKMISRAGRRIPRWSSIRQSHMRMMDITARQCFWESILERMLMLPPIRYPQ